MSTSKNSTFSNSEKTAVYQSPHSGWTAETRVKVNGKNWVITTLKRSRGIISTHCHAVNDEGNGSYSFMMFGDDKNESFYLNELPKGTKATEKTISEAHLKSLALFDQKNEAGELPNKATEYQVEIGQVFFTDGPGYDENRRAVYEIVNDHTFKTVLLDGSDISTDNYVRNYNKKFGIGTYYTEGEKISEDEVNDLLITAHQNIKIRTEQAKIKAENDRIERAEKIKIGSEILPALPADATGIIIGELKQNDSDIQTDYFACSTIHSIYLAFSTHQKNNFQEMRNAAKNSLETEFLAAADADKVENRENYTGGSGYYLGEYKYSGWQVRKGWIPTDAKARAEFLETLQIAIAEGRYFIPSQSAIPAKVENIEAGNISIVDYSEKAFVVIGETKPIKDTLKDLGGRFNFRLSCGPGWVFSKKQLETVKAKLNIQ